MCVCLNCLRTSQMSPRAPKLGWWTCRVFVERVWCLIANSSGTLWRGNCAHKENEEMGEQSIDFMSKHLGSCDSFQMPSIFDKRCQHTRFMAINLSISYAIENKCKICRTDFDKKALGQGGLPVNSCRTMGRHGGEWAWAQIYFSF